MGTWLVTGGAGYIGSHVVRRLVEAGRAVVVIDDLSTGFREFVPDAVPFVESSVTDEAAVATTLRDYGVTGVVHLAALKYAGVSMEEPLRFYRANVEGTRALLAAMVATGVEQLVYSSSSSVYGTPVADRVVESTPWAPESPYGETKLIGEWLVADTARIHPLRHTSLRYFNVVGSGYDDLYDASPHNLFPLVFRAIEAGEAPQVNGVDYPTPDGSCVRDYVHVGDLADAHVLAAVRLEEGRSLRPVYNVGNGTGASVIEVIDTVADVLGMDIEPRIAPRRPGDPARIVADGTLAREDLGWKPQHDLADMVSGAWSAWQHRLRTRDE
ncbi:MAG: UDP-glucose 4-epimerase GalE [Acidimicrobiales bacterium]